MSALQAPSLFDDVATEGVPHPGQWRLARVEVVNWGTFCGWHRMDVSRLGLLITGESGSGKSSLLDAAACVLTPPRALRLNAAAQSEGVRAKDRTLCSYIRGAWNNQTDDSGEISSSYLRDKSATWSGVLLRYECGLARDALNLVALYHLKANSTSSEGLSTLYVVADGDQTLLDFEPYVANGMDTKGLNRNFKGSAQVYSKHGPFAARFNQRMGMHGAKTLELLHRTQAAKNFGSLDDLFRKFMLDEPKTFAQKDAAVAQFSALRQAYDGVVDQRNQLNALEPLVEQTRRHDKAEARQAQAVRLQQVLSGYTTQVIIGRLQAQQVEFERDEQRLSTDVERAAAERSRAWQEVAQAQAALNEKGGFALDSAEKDRLLAQQHVDAVLADRERLANDLAACGAGGLPDSPQAWSELVSRVKRGVQQIEDRRDQANSEIAESYELRGRIQRQIEDNDQELRHLRAYPTNIPRELDEVRLGLAAELGVDAKELPFAGELIDVREEFAEWRGAIERVLSSQAKTLLVAHDYVPAVRRYVDARHLGLRFEFEDVPLDIEVPEVRAASRSLIRRVEVATHARHPEYSKWVNRLIRTKFDYICVDSPDELGEHCQALTCAGQVKHGSRHIKDDRCRVDDRSRWVLGSTNEAKIEELERVRARLARELAQAQAQVDDVERRRRRDIDLQRLGRALEDADWKNYDLADAQSALVSAERFLKQLQRGSKEMDEARRLRDAAQKRLDAAEEVLQNLQVDARENERKLDEVRRQLARHRERLAAQRRPDEADRARLQELFECTAKTSSGPSDDIGAVYTISSAVQSRLDDQKSKAAEEVRKSRTAIERTIDAYRSQWRAESADLGAGYEAREEYLRVHRNIKASGLPRFEREFLKVLNDFSQDQITVISVTIRDALREVRDKIRLVNRSLGLSDYSPGIHLQIDVKECRSNQANQFLADLKAITQGSYDNTDLASAESRYRQTAKVMERLSSDEPADRRWCAECLDTRRHVSFRAKEVDDQGIVQNIHDSDAGLSGGQKQKLVIFCLAAALRYQLTDEDEPTPSYGTVMLDEAFDKADHRFAATAMDIFEAFGFQMVLATPMKLLQTADDHIGGVAYVHCQDRKYSTVQLLSFEDDTLDDAAQAAGTGGIDDAPVPESPLEP